MSEKSERINRLAKVEIQKMHRENSDNALVTAIELMLTDRPARDVVMALRSWADYLEERI